MKIAVSIFLLTLTLFAKEITPSEAYGEVMLISDEIHALLKYYKIPHDHKGIIKDVYVDIKVKPRDVWQKTYEIMVKINILRNRHHLPTIEPVNMTPVLDLNPDLVYEQTQRLITELHIFKKRVGIHGSNHKKYSFKNKTPLDLFNALSHISAAFDELNKGGLTPSYVFGENMRVYNDLTVILQHLDIKDETIPAKKDTHASPKDTFETGMRMLSKIKQLQIKSGIEFVDFSGLKKKNIMPSDVFTITSLIIAELQPIKAYIGINDYVTPAASKYKSKTPVEVGQLINWNLRKLMLIKSLEGVRK